MKKLVCIIFLVVFATGLKAQEKQRAIGIRGGLSSGIEYRVFTSEHSSYKALLSTRNGGLQLVGLKEFHEPGIFDFSDQMSLIYGFGIHVGYECWDKVKDHSNYVYTENRTSPVAGLDGLAGVEYNFWEAPLSLGFEVKPFFDLFGRKFIRIQPFDFAFTLKYNF